MVVFFLLFLFCTANFFHTYAAKWSSTIIKRWSSCLWLCWEVYRLVFTVRERKFLSVGLKDLGQFFLSIQKVLLCIYWLIKLPEQFWGLINRWIFDFHSVGWTLGLLRQFFQKRQFLLVVKEIHFISKWNSSLIQPCGDCVAPIDVDPVGGGWAGGAHVGADFCKRCILFAL